MIFDIWNYKVAFCDAHILFKQYRYDAVIVVCIESDSHMHVGSRGRMHVGSRGRMHVGSRGRPLTLNC